MFGTSGIIKSDKSINVIYNGSLLNSYRPYFWKVKVQANNGLSKWSAPAKWDMGILKASEWQAQWIGLDTFSRNDRPHADYTRLGARYIRKNVAVRKQISRAIAYISGLGLYELYINGKKIGNDILAPTLKEYNKAVPYNSLDITNDLKKGANAVGVILGNGRFFAMRGSKGTNEWVTGIPPITNYGYPKLLMQIRIDYEDGSYEIIKTDNSWKITDNGPIIEIKNMMLIKK